MQELTYHEMMDVEGGVSFECLFSLLGLGGALVGTGISFAALSPWGIGLGVIGIQTSFVSAISSCGTRG